MLQSMTLDHILVMTEDLAGSETFFKGLANLESGPRPPFPFPGSWLYAGGKPIVHLALSQTAGGDNYLGSRSNRQSTHVDHIAFTGDDPDAFVKRLNDSRLPHFERFVPETGERQIFVTGPGGLKLEFIFR